LTVDKRILEADTGRVLLGGRIKNSSRPCLIWGAHAHGAGLAIRVNVTPREPGVSQSEASLPDGNDFRVGGGIVGRRDLIGSASYDFSALHNQGGKRPTFTVSGIFQGELYHSRHESVWHG
jgi:hypothetical protein